MHELRDYERGSGDINSYSKERACILERNNCRYHRSSAFILLEAVSYFLANVTGYLLYYLRQRTTSDLPLVPTVEAAPIGLYVGSLLY